MSGNPRPDQTALLAINAFSHSGKAWQTFLHTQRLVPKRQRQLAEHLAQLGLISEDATCELALGAALLLSTHWKADDRERLVARFAVLWIDRRPTSGRIEIMLWLVEALSSQSPELLARKHKIVEALKQFVQIGPKHETALLTCRMKSLQLSHELLFS